MTTSLGRRLSRFATEAIASTPEDDHKIREEYSEIVEAAVNNLGNIFRKYLTDLSTVLIHYFDTRKEVSLYQRQSYLKELLRNSVGYKEFMADVDALPPDANEKATGVAGPEGEAQFKQDWRDAMNDLMDSTAIQVHRALEAKDFRNV